MTALASAAQSKYVASCQKAVHNKLEPGLVFDADDTTLWTSDMEDGAMRFNFDPAVQDTDCVQPQRFATYYLP